MTGHDNDTRRQVVAYALEHGDSAAARHFGVHRGTVARWRKAHPTPAAPAASPASPAAPAASPPDLPEEFAALTDKEVRWALAYVGRAGGNKTKAAELAGYQGNRETLRAIGSEISRKPHVRAAVDALMARESMTDREILWRLTAQASADLAQYLTPDATLDLEGLQADGMGHLLKEVKVNKDGSLTVKIHDAQSALDKLARIKGLYKDSVTVKTQVALEDLLGAVREADEEMAADG